MIEIGTTDPVLVMYDIRGKQDFIYRSSKIKEIVGGSAIIRDCFTDYLYPAAIKVRNRIEASDDNRKSAIYSYDAFSETLEKFSFDRFIKRVSEEQYLGEVIYDGGGNFLILFKNREIQKAVTAQLHGMLSAIQGRCVYCVPVSAVCVRIIIIQKILLIPVITTGCISSTGMMKTRLLPASRTRLFRVCRRIIILPAR